MAYDCLFHSILTNVTVVIPTTDSDWQTSVVQSVKATEIRFVVVILHSAFTQVHFHVFCLSSVNNNRQS